MKKRFAALALAGIMAAASLTGCGGKTGTAGPVESAAAKEQEKTEGAKTEAAQTETAKTDAGEELEGEITMWHSFTQGPRLETIQKDDPTIQKFAHAEQVITEQIQGGTAIGFDRGPNLNAGIMTNQHVIEKMFQDIITNGTDVMTAAKAAEDELNALFEASQQ